MVHSYKVLSIIESGKVLSCEQQKLTQVDRNRKRSDQKDSGQLPESPERLEKQLRKQKQGQQSGPWSKSCYKISLVRTLLLPRWKVGCLRVSHCLCHCHSQLWTSDPALGLAATAVWKCDMSVPNHTSPVIRMASLGSPRSFLLPPSSLLLLLLLLFPSPFFSVSHLCFHVHHLYLYLSFLPLLPPPFPSLSSSSSSPSSLSLQ